MFKALDALLFEVLSVSSLVIRLFWEKNILRRYKKIMSRIIKDKKKKRSNFYVLVIRKVLKKEKIKERKREEIKKHVKIYNLN